MFPQIRRDDLLSVHPVAILDRKLGKLNNKDAVYILVKLLNGDADGATWEVYDDVMQRFPEFTAAEEQTQETF